MSPLPVLLGVSAMAVQWLCVPFIGWWWGLLVEIAYAYLVLLIIYRRWFGTWEPRLWRTL